MNEEKRIPSDRTHKRKHFFPADLLNSAGILLLASLVGYLFERLGFAEANIITVYVLAVLVISVTVNSRLWSLLSSVVSVLVFNFLFTNPKFTLKVYDQGYPVTFLVMLAAALLTGTLAARLKQNAELSAQAAFRTRILFETNQRMQQAQKNEEILSITVQQLSLLLDRDIILYPAESGTLGEPLVSWNKEDSSQGNYLLEREAAEWVMQHDVPAGASTQVFPESDVLYLPIHLKDTVYGIAGVQIGPQQIDPYENSIVLAVLGECALALENRKNATEKERAAVLAKNEQLRANLLRAISHDLRTPLTSISGNASNLIYNGDSFDSETKNRLYQDIYDDSMWLINLVENLLSVTRIEEGRLNLRISVELIDELIKEALRHINYAGTKHEIVVRHQDDLLLVRADVRLIVQLMINLIDNAVKYTPEGSKIIITTARQESRAVISVEDNGPGIPDEEKQYIFDLFYSGANRVADSRRSMGMGLALCRSIVSVHGGTLRVSDNNPHGTVFLFDLPAGEVELHEETVNPGSRG